MQFRLRTSILILILFFFPISSYAQMITDWTPISGGWLQENGSIYQKEIGKPMYSASRTLITDELGTATNYDLAMKIESGTVLFRLTQEDKKDNAYALIISPLGSMELYLQKANMFTTLLKKVTIPVGVKKHMLSISVVNSSISVWLDTDETELPDISITNVEYPHGTIKIIPSLNSSVEGVVIKNRMSITVSPPHLYPNTTARITLSSSVPLDAVELSLINPQNEVWKIQSPISCRKKQLCELTLPQDFKKNSLSILGTYTLVVHNGNEISKVLLEVKEKPLTSFLQFTDIHNDIPELKNTIQKINSDAFFPHPDFAVITGDSTNFGTQQELTEAKTALDEFTFPYYVTNGNHDVAGEKGSDAGRTWAAVFGPDTFSTYWMNNNVLFATLDVDTPYGGFGPMPGSPEHIYWLKNLVAQNPSKYLFLFDHYGFAPVRDAGGAKTYWDSPTSAKIMRTFLETQKKAVINFAGHAHISGLTKLHDVFYIQSPAFVHIGQYRLVEVYKDRIESLLFKKRDHVKKDDYIDDEQAWAFDTDFSHKANSYSYGLPFERQFAINLPSKTNDILSAIVTSGTNSIKDYQLKTEITLHKEDNYGESRAGVLVRYINPENYYEIALDSASNTVRIQKKQNGALVLLKTKPFDIKTGETYFLTVTVKNKAIEVSVDDLPVLTVNDDTFKQGRVGLKSYYAPTDYINTSLTPLYCFFSICL